MGATDQDAGQTWEAIIFNALASLILLMLWRSDRSIKYVESLKLTDWQKWIGDLGNSIAFVTSWLSILMPCQGLAVIYWWRHVTFSHSDSLPWQLNLLFGVGLSAYLVSIFWLMLSAMSRPVRQTQHHRKEMINAIKKVNSPAEWDALVRRMAALDRRLNETWQSTNAGGLWCAAVLACLVVAVTVLINVLYSYRRHRNYTHVMTEEPLQIIYFFLSTALAAILGLVLASASYVSPYWYPKDCILTTAMHSTKAPDTDTRIERMRFTLCARQLPLGAKLCGSLVTTALVTRLYLQIGVAMPTVLSVLQAVALNQQNSADSTAPPHVES